MRKDGARARIAIFVVATALVANASPGRSTSGIEAKEFPARILAAHNRARADAGLPAVTWDNGLGEAAAKYAFQLAITNRFHHSDPVGRGGAGENLWMGSRGGYRFEAMIGSWLSEERLFRPGIFPLVSRTRNWQDVGHYTQIVWPTTQKIGCALATNAAYDYLVCRYWPAGNVKGVAVSHWAASAAR